MSIINFSTNSKSFKASYFFWLCLASLFPWPIFGSKCDCRTKSSECLVCTLYKSTIFGCTNKYFQKSAAQISDHLLQAEQSKHSQSAFAEMQRSRSELPVFEFRTHLLDMVRQNSVILVKGETGCGKTTQVNIGPMWTLSR